MLITKEKIIDLLHQMPNEIEVDEIVDQIKLTAKIDQALNESENNSGQNWEDFKKEWLSEN